ncbi:hypothetical protein D3C87_997360 [compost metagenome]
MLRQLFETTAIGQQRQLIHARDLHSGQLLLGHFRQITQQRALFLVEVAGLGVDQAQRAHFIAIGHGQRVTGVEANVRRACHQRVVMEAHILAGVRHQQQAVVKNRMAAERDIPRCLADIQAHARLEPLPIGVDQRHQCNRHIEQAFRQPCQSVETFFRGGIEQLKTVQRLNARRFIRRFSWNQHQHTPLATMLPSVALIWQWLTFAPPGMARPHRPRA